MNRAAKQYLHQVGKNLICPYSQKKSFLRQLGSDLDAYCESRPEITPEELGSTFGAPEEVANDFLAEMGPAKLSKAALRHSRRLYFGVGILLAVLAIGVGMSVNAEIEHKIEFDPTELRENTIVTEGNHHITSFYMESDHGPQYWEYDHITNTWINKTKPEGLNIQLSSLGEIYIGSEEGDAIAWKYNPSSNIWEEIPSAPANDSPVEATKENVIDRYYMYSRKHGLQYWEYNRETESWKNLPKPEDLDIEPCYFAEVSYMTVSGLYARFRYDAEENKWQISNKLE